MNSTYQFFFKSLCSLGAISLLGMTFMAPVGALANEAPSKVAALGLGGSAKILLVATDEELKLSKDEGQTWSRVSLPAQAKNKKVNAIATSAGNGESMYLAGPQFGVLYSKDAGRSWKHVNEGLPSTEVVTLSTHAEQPNTVYAYINGKGIFRSQNEGGSWRLMDKGPREPIMQFVHSNMAGSMETGWLFAATKDGVRRSMDCFCGWHRADDVPGELHAIAYDPDEPQRIYAAGKEGLFVSADGGEEWTRINGTPLTSLVAAPAGVLYGAGKGGLFRSRDKGATWEKVSEK
jgi:photosystem II stability/assembly factor-like uncharacterized protein